MKKYSFLFILSVIILISFVSTPDVIYASLPQVSYTKVVKKDVDITVNVQGKIGYENQPEQTDDLSKYTVYQTTQTTNLEDEEKVAWLYLSEDICSRIKVGQSVSITGSAFENKSFKGKIIEISDVATTNSTGVVFLQAKAEIENPDNDLKVGYNIKAKVVVEHLSDVLLVPNECILQDDLGEYVYKIYDSTTTKTYIKTGEITSLGTVVTKGLKETDFLVTSPDESFAQKQSVAVKGTKNA